MQKMVTRLSCFLVGNDWFGEEDWKQALCTGGTNVYHLHVDNVPLDLKHADDDTIKRVESDNCVDLAVLNRLFKTRKEDIGMKGVVKRGEIYRHFKGKNVKVLCVSQNSEMPGSYDVVYECSDGEVWHRPLEMFMSPVDREKYPEVKQGRRFELDTEATEEGNIDYIKPCPFCGGTANLQNTEISLSRGYSVGALWEVRCNKCQIKVSSKIKTDYEVGEDGVFRVVGRYDGRLEVIERWNNRA